jgi:hypothetical protein
MVWPVKTHPAHSTGLESKKNSSDGEGFSLDRSFYRTDISNPAPRNLRIAGKNEAAGAADAELCHTEALWAGKVRYYRLCVVKC